MDKETQKKIVDFFDEMDLEAVTLIKTDKKLISVGTPEMLKFLNNMMVEAGKILHQLYELSRHPQALSAHADLTALHEELGEPKATGNLLDIYRIAKGPIIRNLDGDLEAFVPVEPRQPGRNVFPWGIEKAELSDFLDGGSRIGSKLVKEWRNCREFDSL